MKIPRSTASKVGLTLEKSPVDISLFFFLSPNKQKVEHQSESNSVTFWTPSPWKASLYCATLKKKKKSRAISPHQPLQSCLPKTAEQTGEDHMPCVFPYSPQAK
jgi:hypothetical protein